MIAFHALQMGTAFCGERGKRFVFREVELGVEIDRGVLRQNCNYALSG